MIKNIAVIATIAVSIAIGFASTAASAAAPTVAPVAPAKPASATNATAAAKPSVATPGKPATTGTPAPSHASRTTPRRVASLSAAHAQHRPRADADARVCLEFPTTMQIIKCSEKYRWAAASGERG